MHNAASGANKTDAHVTGLNPGRDFPLEHVADIRNTVDGDPCPRCGKPLAFKTCIEVGHVFKLGTKYSDAMNCTYLDAAGKSKPMIMGCYGIGLNRILAAAIEASHDDDGIIWPISIAPFHVTVLALDPKDDAVRGVAEKLHDDLSADGLDVLLDDRDLRPGPKFKDADLIGLPLRITVGKKSLTDGVVEFKARADGEVQKVSPDEAVALVRSAMAKS
jgi:prolyl-tRNA synthetase